MAMGRKMRRRARSTGGGDELTLPHGPPPGAYEIARVFVEGGGGTQVALRPYPDEAALKNEPSFWAIILSDLATHAARMMMQRGWAPTASGRAIPGAITGPAELDEGVFAAKLLENAADIAREGGVEMTGGLVRPPGDDDDLNNNEGW
jgi:hypothetical protein